ncbi:MAG: ATP cone domain-containing protein, partial [Oscillospiraceae bacterium]|nr:ATP cone domain-containing protein [Oscillospiraceae bacterium]
PLVDLQSVTDEIELELQNSLEREIKTPEIGEMVMKRLKGLDEVSYVRFASVYRQFKDINTFMDELNKLLHEDG